MKKLTTILLLLGTTAFAFDPTMYILMRSSMVSTAQRDALRIAGIQSAEDTGGQPFRLTTESLATNTNYYTIQVTAIDPADRTLIAVTTTTGRGYILQTLAIVDQEPVLIKYNTLPADYDIGVSTH